MAQASEAIERFFRTYESNVSNDNAAAAISQFADVFMAANPQGAQAVRAGDFALALPKRKQLFDTPRMPIERAGLAERTAPGRRYVMAATQWKMTFVRTEAEPEEVVVDSTYIVDTGGNSPKIVLYLANHDIMQILKDRGLLPA